MNIGDVYRFGSIYWVCNRIYVEPHSKQTIISGKITNSDDPDIFYFNLDGDTIKIGLSHSSERTYDSIENEKLQKVGTVSDEELLKFFKAECKVLYYASARKAFRNGDQFYNGSLLRFSDERCFAVIKRHKPSGMVYGYDIIPSDGRCLVTSREERMLCKWSPIGTLKYEIYQILHHLRNFDSDGTLKDFSSSYEQL